MTRDYKNSPRRAVRGGGSGKIVFAGIIIGLLMGIIVALGIALYLNRSPSPFVNKTQQPGPKKAPEAKAPEIAKPLESLPPGVAKPGDKPRFDFYDILPGDKDPSKRPAEKPTKEAAPAVAKAPEQLPAPMPAKPAGNKDSYFLQAGSFRSSAEADNLKARLALMGMEANVMPADVPNIGTMYRVRVGPYRSSDEMTSAKNQMAKDGIQASVIKMTATQNN